MTKRSDTKICAKIVSMLSVTVTVTRLASVFGFLLTVQSVDILGMIRAGAQSDIV
jgi:hypothetical protein